MKLPFIDNDSDLKNPTLSSNIPCHLAVNSRQCSLPKDCFWSSPLHPECDPAMHIAFQTSYSKQFFSHIPIQEIGGLQPEDFAGQLWENSHLIDHPGKLSLQKFLTSHKKWGEAPSFLKCTWPYLFNLLPMKATSPFNVSSDESNKKFKYPVRSCRGLEL